MDVNNDTIPDNRENTMLRYNCNQESIQNTTIMGDTQRPRLTLSQMHQLSIGQFLLTFSVQKLQLWKDGIWYHRLLISILLAYQPSFFDGSEYTCQGRYWEGFVLCPIWRWLFSIFPCTVHFETPLSNDRQYILSSHPHGVLSLHHAFYMTSREFHKQQPGKWKRHVGASIVFKIPFYRELMLWCGVIDAERKVVDAVLSKGYSLVAQTGGISEQTRSNIGKHFIFVKSRKGIFSSALRYGISLVPSYSFGENDQVKTQDWGMKFRAYLSDKYRIPACIPASLQGFFPTRTRISCFVGTPIEVQRITVPSAEDIANLQNRYIDAMIKLFNSHKAECGYPDAQLCVL